MRRIVLGFGGAVLLAAAVIACGPTGTQQTAVTPNSVSGPVKLGSGPVVQTVTPTGPVAGATLVYTGGGSGTVAASMATAPPSGVTPLARMRIVADNRGTLATASASPTPTPAPVATVYITLTSSTGATLPGIPEVNLSYSSAVTGTFDEEIWNGSSWTIVGTVTVTNTTNVAFPTGSTSQTIASNGSLTIAVMEVTPSPTPVPTPTPTATSEIVNGGFESGTSSVAAYAGYGNPVGGSGGWVQCTIDQAGPSPSPYPFQTASSGAPAYTPEPGWTPQAQALASGTTIPTPAATPTMSVTTMQVHSGTYGAAVGGIFSGSGTDGYGDEDARYWGMCQQITIPAQGANFSAYVMYNGNESGITGTGVGTSNGGGVTGNYVHLDVDLLDTNGNFLSNLYDEGAPATATSPGDTAFRQITASIPASATSSTGASIAGTKAELFIGLWTRSGGSGTKYGGYYFVDDVSLIPNNATTAANARGAGTAATLTGTAR